MGDDFTAGHREAFGGYDDERLKVLDGGRSPPGNGAADPSPLMPQPFVWRDPSAIPPRRWLLGTTLVRGKATILGSPGGVGKTAVAVSAGLSVLTGRDLLDEHVFVRGPVWFITLEDDQEELERRIHAAMLLHEIEPQEVSDRLFVNDATKRPLLLAKTNDRTGEFEVCADKERIEKCIKDYGIVLTIIDPLVKSHRAIENSNEHMDGLIGLMNEIATNTETSLLLPCHFRKGGGDGGRDAIRGGSSLVDGARVSRTLIQMTEDEAKAFDLPVDDAFRYLRMHDPKRNMTPRDKAKWFELTSMPLGNHDVDPLYPAGDNVQAAQVWRREPSVLQTAQAVELNAALDEIAKGPEEGVLFSPAHTKGTDRWCGNVLIKRFGVSQNEAGRMVAKWLKSGLLVKLKFYHAGQRKEIGGVSVNNVLRPGC